MRHPLGGKADTVGKDGATNIGLRHVGTCRRLSGCDRKSYLRIISLEPTSGAICTFADEGDSHNVSATHVRLNKSLLAASEKRLLIWIAERLPRWIHSDHLSALGLLAMAGAGAAFMADAVRSCCRRRSCRVLPAAELVRRQPRRHAGPSPKPVAAALWLLRRPRHRPRRHGHAVCRAGCVGFHESPRSPRCSWPLSFWCRPKRTWQPTPGASLKCRFWASARPNSGLS